MSRRRVVDEPVSHERWLVSYADFITLLFAFFVVMYSISQVNDGKYKVLSATLSEAFSSHQVSYPERTLDPFQIGELAKSNPFNLIELKPGAAIIENQSGSDADGKDLLPVEGGFPSEFEQINIQIDEAFGDLVEQQKITVRGNEEWLEVELKSSLLFSSGDATLSTPALELLGSIADILKGQTSPVRVEGFTDNIPINTPQFPSNWELSASRASAVVQLFIEEGMDPSRLAAIGYGEHQPVADNVDKEGRAANRRVVLMISKTGELRPELRTLTSAEELINQGQADTIGDQGTGIEIFIPGVNVPDEKDTVEVEAPVVEDPLKGVRTIELKDGGLLFTNETPREDE